MLVERLGDFAVRGVPGRHKDGNELVLLFAAVHLDMPAPSRLLQPAPRLSQQQPALLAEDLYYGEAGCSSLRMEAQVAYCRRGTEIYVDAEACSPAGQPPTGMVAVEVVVGPCHKQVLVFGNRRWRGGLRGNSITAPEPFSVMPLRFEQAFGGTVRDKNEIIEHEPRNPVGCGLYKDERAARDQPLPNLEDPRALIRSPRDRPPPAAVSPCARNWQPRLAYAGSYDQAWLRTRAPLWPVDFNELFFQAAAPGLHCATSLRGGENVLLRGVSPDGDISFVLPSIRLVAKTEFQDTQDRQLMNLDAVDLSPATGTLSLIFRTSVLAPKGLHTHRVSRIRALEPWESAPEVLR